jgi:hypothetical protein
MLRLAALHLPSPFYLKREAFCETHARRRDERIARGYLTIEKEIMPASSSPRRRGPSKFKNGFPLSRE